MKLFFRKNLKIFIAFVLGVVISGVGVYGATLLTTEEVMYTSSKTAKTAIDELYTRTSTMKTLTEYNNYGTARYNAGYAAGKSAGTVALLTSLEASISYYHNDSGASSCSQYTMPKDGYVIFAAVGYNDEGDRLDYAGYINGSIKFSSRGISGLYSAPKNSVVKVCTTWNSSYASGTTYAKIIGTS